MKSSVQEKEKSGMSFALGKSSGDLTENIQFMKLLHELKAQFPSVPDEIVKQCILKVSQNS